MLDRKHILVAAATACALLAIPSMASAEDFCVGGPAGCTGTPVPAPLLSSALKQAQSNGTDDRFFIAPGVFASSNFVHQSGERVQIVGAGAGKTILRGNLAGPVVELNGDQDTSISNLTIEATGAATSGLRLMGTRARGVAVKNAGAPGLQVGVEFFGDASFADGRVNVGATGHAVIAYSGSGSISGSTLSASAGAALATAASEMTVRRTTLDGQFGAYVMNGHATLSDTLVDLRGKAVPALGVYAEANSAGTTPAIDADRLTIVGSTPGAPGLFGAAAYANGAGHSASVRLRDSVISGIGVPIARKAENGGTASLTTSRSVYPSPVAILDDGPGNIVEQNRLKVSPGFLGSGDFHLAASSRLIDAGTPGAVSAGATDHDGLPRASDGNGDCAHISDIGAFEYQGTKVTALASAAASTAAVGQAVRFTVTKACVPDPQAPTILWRFDDGAAATGPTVTHQFATPGRHGATATVSDRRGHQAHTTVVIDVTAPPTISRLRVAPRRVQIGTRLPKLVRTTVKRPLATIRFTLSKPATVRLRFTKLGTHGKRRVIKKTVRIKANEGVNRIRFAARLSRTVRLKPSRYRLSIVATDKAGAHSNRATTRFTAVTPRP